MYIWRIFTKWTHLHIQDPEEIEHCQHSAASVTQYCACEIHPCCLLLEFVHFHWCNIFSVWLYGNLLLMNMWLVLILASTEFLWLFMYCILVHTCLQFCWVNKWLEVELLGHRIWVSSTLIDKYQIVYQWLYPFFFSPAVYE